MSATIILIITSSSTRSTEPRGGRVAVMMSVLAHPKFKFANIACGCNAKITGGADLTFATLPTAIS
jgi:hypothetical protein